MNVVLDYASVDGNAPPDFRRVRAGTDPAIGVIIRAAHGTTIDPTYARDRRAARDAGLVVGAYGIIEWVSAAPEVQAKALCRALGAHEPSDLPPAVDVEFSRPPSTCGLTAKNVVDIVERYVGTVTETLGVTPLIYTSQNQWLENIGDLDSAKIGACPLWLKTPYSRVARRPPSTNDRRIGDDFVRPRPWRMLGRAPVVLQQFQGDALGFPGFSSTVDLSAWDPWSVLVGTRAGAAWAWGRLIAAGAVAEAPPDRVWSPELEQAVRAYQGARGLTPDGVVGIRTFARLASERA